MDDDERPDPVLPPAVDQVQDLINAVDQVQDLINETQEAIASYDRQLERLAEQAKPIRHERTRAELRLKLLKEILNTFEIDPDEDDEEPPSTWASSLSSMQPDAVVHTAERQWVCGVKQPTTSERIRSQVSEILEAADGPMHINAIHQEFVVRGWPVPGAGLPGNITAHLTRATDIRSPQRAYYEIGPNNIDRKTRSTRTRTRTRKNTK